MIESKNSDSSFSSGRSRKFICQAVNEETNKDDDQGQNSKKSNTNLVWYWKTHQHVAGSLLKIFFSIWLLMENMKFSGDEDYGFFSRNLWDSVGKLWKFYRQVPRKSLWLWKIKLMIFFFYVFIRRLKIFFRIKKKLIMWFF